MTRPDEFNPVNNFPTQSQVMFHCLEKQLKGKKNLLGFFPPCLTSSEEFFLCQGPGILSFMLIRYLVARIGSKGNSHHKFIGGKLAPGISFLEAVLIL